MMTTHTLTLSGVAFPLFAFHSLGHTENHTFTHSATEVQIWLPSVIRQYIGKHNQFSMFGANHNHAIGHGRKSQSRYWTQ